MDTKKLPQVSYNQNILDLLLSLVILIFLVISGGYILFLLINNQLLSVVFSLMAALFGSFYIYLTLKKVALTDSYLIVEDRLHTNRIPWSDIASVSLTDENFSRNYQIKTVDNGTFFIPQRVKDSTFNTVNTVRASTNFERDLEKYGNLKSIEPLVNKSFLWMVSNTKKRWVKVGKEYKATDFVDKISSPFYK